MMTRTDVPPASRRPLPQAGGTPAVRAVWPRQSGFTLVEVLAAVVLIGIVLPVAMHALSISANVGDLARRKAEAAELAQSKLSELAVTRVWQGGQGGGGQLSGDFGEDHPEFQWTANLENWDQSTLQQLDVHVSWMQGGRELRATVSTLVETVE